MKRFKKAGVIARFKPLHNGGAKMLDAMCRNAEQIVIGVGSCNKYNIRNPFTPEESKQMLEAYLQPRFTKYSILYVPDYAQIPEYRDGQKWKQEVISLFGDLDAFISGNPWSAKLLSDTYRIIHPGELIPREKWIWVRATQVRIGMAQGSRWQNLVPYEVAKYIQKNKLDERFRKEFGLETLAQLIEGADYSAPESARKEREHTYEK